MPVALRSLAAAITLISTLANAQSDIVGTWTTKSRKVVTGPGFYDPVGERMFEPDLTGFSYSFTADGHYEEAYYRAISNPGNPSCPSGIIQWQHGTYTHNANGSLSLTPIAVDGRQLLSDPCNYQNAVYTRYHQPELFKSYEVIAVDPYSKAQRLNLFAFDGSPLNPMYLAYQPPQMLPTVTLNPTASSTGAGAATGTAAAGGKLRKRWHGGDSHVVEDDAAVGERLQGNLKRGAGREPIDADKWWWIGVGMTAVGGLAYYSF